VKLTRHVAEFNNLTASIRDGDVCCIHRHIELLGCLFRFGRLGYRSSALLVDTYREEKGIFRRKQTWIEHKNSPSLTAASLEATFALFLFETPVAATLPLELDSAFDDLPFPAMLDLAALSSLILAAFSFWESLSEASSSSTTLRAFFCWCVSWAFLYAWVVRAVFLARRVKVSLRWFLRTPVSSAALISAATFSSTSCALVTLNYNRVTNQ